MVYLLRKSQSLYPNVNQLKSLRNSFMMGVMATNQSLDGETIELLMVDYGIEKPNKGWKWTMPNVSLSKMAILMKMNWLSVHSCNHRRTR